MVFLPLHSAKCGQQSLYVSRLTKLPLSLEVFRMSPKSTAWPAGPSWAHLDWSRSLLAWVNLRTFQMVFLPLYSAKCGQQSLYVSRLTKLPLSLEVFRMSPKSRACPAGPSWAHPDWFTSLLVPSPLGSYPLCYLQCPEQATPSFVSRFLSLKLPLSPTHFKEPPASSSHHSTASSVRFNKKNSFHLMWVVLFRAFLCIQSLNPLINSLR